MTQMSAYPGFVIRSI